MQPVSSYSTISQFYSKLKKIDDLLSEFNTKQNFKILCEAYELCRQSSGSQEVLTRICLILGHAAVLQDSESYKTGFLYAFLLRIGIILDDINFDFNLGARQNPFSSYQINVNLTLSERKIKETLFTFEECALLSTLLHALDLKPLADMLGDSSTALIKQANQLLTQINRLANQDKELNIEEIADWVEQATELCNQADEEIKGLSTEINRLRKETDKYRNLIIQISVRQIYETVKESIHSFNQSLTVCLLNNNPDNCKTLVASRVNLKLKLESLPPVFQSAITDRMKASFLIANSLLRAVKGK